MSDDVILYKSDEQPFCASVINTRYGNNYVEYYDSADFKDRHEDSVKMHDILTQFYMEEHPCPEDDDKFENEYAPQMHGWAIEHLKEENIVETAREYPAILGDETLLPNEPKTTYTDADGIEYKYKEVEVYKKCGAVFLKTGDNTEDIHFLCLEHEVQVYAEYIKNRYEAAKQEYLENEPF